MDVSVVMCVRNGKGVIDNQLDSLAAQKASVDWEVIVCDNGSTDGTVEYCQTRARTFPVPLRVVDVGSVPSISAGRNAGAKASQAEILAYCDCDDRVSDTWVQAAYNALSCGADIAGGLNRELRGSCEPNTRVLNPGCLLGGPGHYGVIGCNFAVRRDTYLRVGGFDEGLPAYGCDDSEFSLRMNMAKAVFVPAPEMLLYFRPTTNPRVLLKKVYQSGMAEQVVWHRYPQIFGERMTVGSLGAVLLRWPVDAVRMLRSAGLAAGTKPALRRLVTYMGHLDAELRWAQRGKIKPRKLIALDDDHE